jgi:transmembrane sensor
MPKRISKSEAEALLEKYFAGRCTPREIEIINRWYQSYERKEVPGLSDPQHQAFVRQEMLERIRQDTGISKLISPSKHGEGSGTPLHAHRYRLLWKVAAVFIVVVISGLYFYSGISRLEDGINSRRVSLKNKPDPDVKMMTSAGPVVYLSDGSVVWLKERSRLQYPERFSGKLREVTLTGEAFFDVAENAERPFVIHSANFTTRVLGTSFNIKDYTDGDSPEVVVVTGKVMVSLNGPGSDQVGELVLHPNKKAVYSAKENTLRERHVLEADVEDLGKRKLDFEEARLDDIVNVLNVEYKVQIRLAHQDMHECIITANLSGLDLKVGLETLSKAINGSYSVEEDVIMINGDGCTLKINP